jgi:hypothetical protein
MMAMAASRPLNGSELPDNGGAVIGQRVAHYDIEQPLVEPDAVPT